MANPTISISLGQLVELVESFTYLGCRIDHKVEVEIRRRIEIAMDNAQCWA